jgi:hypothetical protein
MKPLNYDNSPCSPTSSNCVIWQGPDLHIIKLCKGDTISDVIASLATELAIVMDQLSITNYDLSCFELVGCKPETYQELLQFLIEQICLSQGLSTTATAVKSDDVLITVAPCFIVNGITVMTLIDYVTAIGNKLCDIVDQIAVINNTLNEYNIRITTLENAVIPTYTLPSITVDCTLQNSPLVGSGTPALPIDQILSILINDDTYGYCALRTAIGLPANLNAAVLSQCILNSDIQLSSSTGATWSTNPNWDQTPTTVADTINNIWLAICDIYNYLEDVITVQDTNTVNLTLSSTNVLSADIQDSGWHPLNGFEWYGPNIISQRPRARRIGNVIYFKGVVMVPLANAITDQPIVWDYQQPSINTYAPLTSIKPAETGAGSVIINSGGSITFNQGNSVIPAAVLPLAINLDDNYSFNWEMGWRNIQMVSATASITTSMLTTLFRPIITIDKKLVFQLVEDIEQSASSITGNVYGTSLANNLISNVQSGEYVPFYRDATSVMNSSPTAGLQNVKLMYGGPITIPPGTVDYTFPFTCQASDEEQVGGFGWIKLDPYSTYISPCAVSIPTPNPCAIP